MKNAAVTCLFLGIAEGFSQTNTFPASGDVGIGTTSPSAKLEVTNGSPGTPSFLRVQPSDQFFQLRLSHTTAGSNMAGAEITTIRPTGQSSNGGAAMLGLGYDASALLPETGVNKSYLYLRNDDIFTSVIGLNTSNVSTSILYQSSLLEVNTADGQKFGRTRLSTQHANHFRWEFDNVEKMRITSSGVVAIGTVLTTNPNNYKLAVNGKIGAKEVQVENTSTTWADYVFAPLRRSITSCVLTSTAPIIPVPVLSLITTVRMTTGEVTLKFR